MSCVFCSIVERKIPTKIVLETEEVLAFHDAQPQAPVHILFVPKKHVSGIHELSTDGRIPLDALFLCANEVAKKLNIAERGYRLVVNCKAEGGQSVDHLHLHLLGGRKMNWPPG